MNYYDSRRLFIWDHIPYITRGLGVITAVALWGVGVDMIYHRHQFGIYLVSFSLILFLLEIVWVVSLFLEVCIKNENSRIFNCWDIVTWFNTWKKSVFYWAASISFFYQKLAGWLPTTAGSLLVVLGFFHLLLFYKQRLEAKETLLERRDDLYEKDEDEDDSHSFQEIPNGGDSDSGSTQEYHLQV